MGEFLIPVVEWRSGGWDFVPVQRADRLIRDIEHKIASWDYINHVPIRPFDQGHKLVNGRAETLYASQLGNFA